jgi:predicted Zn-dependent protease
MNGRGVFKQKIRPSTETEMSGRLTTSVVALSMSFLAGCAVNPITGGKELMLFPEEHDVELGASYAPEIEKQLGGKIPNETVQNYIDSVGQRIAAVSHKPSLKYHFTAVEDDSINAFALPGGYIFITKGMLGKLESEQQLAAILAHETTHVVARDTAAAMSKEIGIGLLLSAVSSAGTSEGVITAADLARQILGLRYSRQDEYEADIGGLEYMVRAGYNPRGMLETMQMLEEEGKSARVPEFFSTHPSPANRQAYIRSRIESRYTAAPFQAPTDDYRRYVLEKLGP